MGTNLQERAATQRLERVSIRERDWKHKASWSSNNRPNVISNKMGKRQSQRKTVQPHALLSQDNSDKRLQQRRKHKPNTPSSKRSSCRHSVHGCLDSKPRLVSTSTDRMELKVQEAAERWDHREQSSRGSRARGHTAAFPCQHLPGPGPDPGPDPGSDPVERLSPKLGADSPGDQDSDTDLSESERLPVSSVRVPPQLELRPEVVEAEAAQRHRVKGQSCDGSDFPDFLPPPFNSWNLRQLAFFHNMEGRGAPRPRPVGCLERYLERLLQLEWHQIQTVQEESGKPPASDVPHGCHRSAAAATSRLSTPKCILQCQRAFPLTFLSSLAGHSGFLSSTTCCRSHRTQARQPRISPVLERREPVSLPKRSYSESRVPSSQRSSGPQRFDSPARANNHLQRMQASGNMRNPAQSPGTEPPSSAAPEVRAAGVRRRRSGSERRSGPERRQDGSERKRSGSESRRIGAEFRKSQQDAVTAIMDHLSASKRSTVNRTNRHKQVDFVT